MFSHFLIIILGDILTLCLILSIYISIYLVTWKIICVLIGQNIRYAMYVLKSVGAQVFQSHFNLE